MTALPAIHTRQCWPGDYRGDRPRRTARGDWRRAPGVETLRRSDTLCEQPGQRPKALGRSVQAHWPASPRDGDKHTVGPAPPEHHGPGARGTRVTATGRGREVKV